MGPRRVGRVFGPDDDGAILARRVKIRVYHLSNLKTYLGRSRDVRTGQPDIWGPCDVANPVDVSFQYLFLHPSLIIFPRSKVNRKLQ